MYAASTAAAYHARGLWRDQTIYDVFSANASRWPERTAVVDPPNRATIAFGAPRRLSYRELAALVTGVADRLTREGIRSGDVILVQLPNLHELLALYLAAASLGAVLSPVPMQYRHHELAQIVALLRPVAVCGVATAAGAEPLADFMDHVAFDGKVFGFGDGLPAAVTSLSHPEAIACDAASTSVPVDPDGLFSICWTSGTEGRPKAVPKTHNNWLSSAHGFARTLTVESGDAILAPFPFVNAAAIGGLMMVWLSAGGTLVLHHPFDLGVFLDQIRQEDIRYTVVAPAILSSLLDGAAADPGLLQRLRAVGTGSSPPDPHVVEKFEKALGVPVVNIFGSNEGINLCSTRDNVPAPRARARLFPREGDISWKPETRTANGGEFRLITEEGRPAVAPGDIGEMWIRGPSVFPGYWQPGGLDRSRFDGDGFFSTGDLFEIAEENGEARFVRFVGRSRELIIRGGMKIAPAELDALISSHPDISEAAVAAYGDARLGERVCVFVVPRGGRSVTLESVVAFCREAGLARFKWPERIVHLDRLPRNALAKLQRIELTRMLEAKTASGIPAILSD
nr:MULTISPECIES: class I adenylate-forming enzyme family protein [unclassified Bradyrhizobium]